MAKNKIGVRAGEIEDNIPKKFLDLSGLSKYDAALKAAVDKKDADAISAAKAYADSLGSNYDPAGSAETVKGDVIAQSQELINNVRSELESKITMVQADIDSAEMASANAQATADKAQGEVDALETKVGEIPADAGVATVVDYVNKKTEGIASDAQLKELQGRIGTAETDIDAIQADYLKAADKTELQGNIDAVNAKADALIGTDAGKSARTIANEELAKQLIAEGASESLDTLQEIAAWIQQHPNDASAMNAAIEQLKALIGTMPEGFESSDIVTYIDGINLALKSAIEEEKSRAEGAEATINLNISSLDSKIGVDDVATQVERAKQQALEAAASDATTKADKALADAKAYTATEVGKVNDTVAGVTSRVESLEGTAHMHANKATLDAITDAKVAAWDATEGKANAYADSLFARMQPITNEEIDQLFSRA